MRNFNYFITGPAVVALTEVFILLISYLIFHFLSHIAIISESTWTISNPHVQCGSALSSALVFFSTLKCLY